VLGAISFPQRFGSSPKPHDHDHLLALDGVVSGDAERGVRFHEATRLEALDAEALDAEALARTVPLRVLRWFVRRELLDAAPAADMCTWQRTGGFSVDASVRIEGEDRAGLELLQRLARLVPPPRIHRHRYHGILAPNARLRSNSASLQEVSPRP